MEEANGEIKIVKRQELTKEEAEAKLKELEEQE